MVVKLTKPGFITLKDLDKLNACDDAKHLFREVVGEECSISNKSVDRWIDAWAYERKRFLWFWVKRVRNDLPFINPVHNVPDLLDHGERRTALYMMRFEQIYRFRSFDPCAYKKFLKEFVKLYWVEQRAKEKQHAEEEQQIAVAKFISFVHYLMKGCQYLLIAFLVALTYEYFIIPARTSDVCIRMINLSYQHAFYKDYGGKTFADTVIGDSLEVMAKQYNWR